MPNQNIKEKYRQQILHQYIYPKVCRVIEHLKNTTVDVKKLICILRNTHNFIQ